MSALCAGVSQIRMERRLPGGWTSGFQPPTPCSPRHCNNDSRRASLHHPLPTGEPLHGLRPTGVNEDQSPVWTPDVTRQGTGNHPLPTGEGRRGAHVAEIESSDGTQRSGGVRGQGLPRFTSQLLWWVSRSENPSPRLFRAGCSELIHSTLDCALQSRPSPAGRGWGRLALRVASLPRVRPPHPSSEQGVAPASPYVLRPLGSARPPHPQRRGWRRLALHMCSTLSSMSRISPSTRSFEPTGWLPSLPSRSETNVADDHQPPVRSGRQGFRPSNRQNSGAPTPRRGAR
jgi:hypothetical protein